MNIKATLSNPKARAGLKAAFLALALLLAFLAGREFHELRHYEETVVSAPGLTERKMLSDYLASLEGTWMDSPVFVYDSGVPGGSVFVMGNVHPYEPATSLAAYIIMENIKVSKGKVFVLPQGNRSASTTGMLANAYPKFFSVPTSFGAKKYRLGDRGTNPLDQWPDPFTYVNYPSRQNLAYQDIRNMNRTYPGRPDGTLTERAAYAVMELIRREKIDLAIDMHEASLMYPVVGTYVAHDRSFDLAMMAAMTLTAGSFDMKCESSPKGLRGLSHREWGDYSDTLAVLMETPEPFIDRVVGPMTEQLFTEGKDEFLDVAARHGLTYVPYSYETGAPLWYRCGRHLSGALEAVAQMGAFFPEKEVLVEWPGYEELKEHDCGYFLHDPGKADPKLVFKQ
ncbi:MAG TPA: succinylglutamate desuccinylase [Spirochaetales bacterium]|nr:succinylglutamate desuccinylase [Spirochaetales bacterium]HRY53163.1 deacylase [Spirochaetia bacterium]HRZ63296.1 deacylase [Spirochaetia bacterium]